MPHDETLEPTEQREQVSIQKLQECLLVLSGLHASDNEGIQEVVAILEQRIISVKEDLDRRNNDV